MQEATRIQHNWLPLILFPIALAILSNALWLGELTQVVGWESLAWLSHLHYSVFIIALLAVVAYVIPFRIIHRTPWLELGQAVLEIYPATLIAFFLSKTILFSIHTQWYGYFNYYIFVGLLVLVVLLISFSIHLVTLKLLRRVRFTHGFYMAIGIVMAVPLSLATVRLLPAFNGDVSFVSAVKMGYPFFWIVMLMGFLGMRSAVWQVKTPIETTQEDILDDLPEEE